MELASSDRSDLSERLAALRSTLAAIGALIASASLSASAAAQGGSQQAADQARQSIDVAIQQVEDGGDRHGPHLRVVDMAPDIASVHLDHAMVPRHRPLDVVIDVQASAQVAGLLLSFGAYDLFRTTTLRIGGNRGATEITVTSGTTVDQLAISIQSIHQWTGVVPLATGTGVFLYADTFGQEGFVSVRLVHPTQAPGPTGVYRLSPTDFFQPDPGSRVPWESAQAFAGVRDFGQDLRALVNGHPAWGRGLSLGVWDPELGLQTTLRIGNDPWPGHAFILGPFRAFRIVRD